MRLYNPRVTTMVTEPYSVDVPISVGRVTEIFFTQNAACNSLVVKNS